ncbi:hypothetical protein RCF98_11825 [Thiothrix lacustris]|uniref:Uncharacterized protein n=1 Tax=Thiothrix lacustris TaxID=525917 RepID=A0ABY9MM86_9GAMM|nr:hypothetical protein [Thiothrix lacustris]WML89658.1 hypothetical protein RCF98_11825 [Thiothrix lacustris]
MLTNVFVAIALLLSASSCTVIPTDTAGNRFITDTHAASVAFRSLRVEGQSTIKGQIHRTGRNPVPFGHIGYAVLDASGKVREQGRVEHSAAIRLRNTHRPSLFSIELKQPLASGERVQLIYLND